MTTTRTLKIIIDAAGNAADGIKGIAGSLTPIAAGAAAAVGGIALLGGAAAAAGGFLVTMGSDAQEMQGKFDVVFGQSAPAAAAQLDAFGDAVGRNKFTLMGMAAALQDTFVPLGFARDKAAEMSVEVSKLAVDLGSFNNVSEEIVAGDLQRALTGETEVMKKYGVVINQAAIENEALRLGLISTKDELDAQAKAQATLSLIMQGTTDAQGDAARTSESWANQVRALKANLSEAATTMGIELLPIVTPLLKDFTTWTKDVMPQAITVFKSFAADLSATVGPAMLMINDALTRIAIAFGVNTEKVTATDAVIKAFKMGLDAIVIVVQVVAIGMQGLAWGVEQVSRAVRIAIGLWRQLQTIWDNLTTPPDITPGSPTPLETGLVGIERAALRVGRAMPAMFPTGGPGLAAVGGAGGAGGYGSIIINLTYSPMVSTADRFEVETRLIPLIREALRI